MKKLKGINPSARGEVLSREQLKNVLGGFSEDEGKCQDEGSSCDTQHASNCCNGLYCDEVPPNQTNTCKKSKASE